MFKQTFSEGDVNKKEQRVDSELKLHLYIKMQMNM